MTNSELTSIRKSLNLSKSDFAKMIGIAPVVEGKYEKGSLKIPEAVIQAVYLLKNKMEEEFETEPDADEDISVVNDISRNTLDSDTDQTVAEISAVKTEDELTVNESISVNKETITVEVEDKKPEIKNDAIDDAINTSAVNPSSDSFENAIALLPLAIPFLFPPMLIPNSFLSIGFS